MAKRIVEKKAFFLTRDVTNSDYDTSVVGGDENVVYLWDKKPKRDKNGDWGLGRHGKATYETGDEIGKFDVGCDSMLNLASAFGIKLEPGIRVEINLVIDRAEKVSDVLSSALRSSSCNVKNTAIKQALAEMGNESDK